MTRPAKIKMERQPSPALLLMLMSAAMYIERHAHFASRRFLRRHACHFQSVLMSILRLMFIQRLFVHARRLLQVAETRR